MTTYYVPLDSTNTVVIPANASGKLVIYDGATAVEFNNSPNSRPPIGEIPVGDLLVPWVGRGGFYSRLSDVLNAEVNQLLEVDNSITVRFENDFRVQPTSGTWCYSMIQYGPRERVDISARPARYRVRGNLIVSVLTQITDGMSSLLTIVDTISDHFNSVTISGITFRTPTVSQVGRSSDGLWWRVDISLPYIADELFTSR